MCFKINWNTYEHNHTSDGVFFNNVQNSGAAVILTLLVTRFRIFILDCYQQIVTVISKLVAHRKIVLNKEHPRRRGQCVRPMFGGYRFTTTDCCFKFFVTTPQLFEA
jgi:hypothetical protein